MKTTKIAMMVMLPILASVGTVAEHAYAATCDSLSCTGTISQLTVFRDGHSFGASVRLDTNAAPTGTNCSLADGTSWLVQPGNGEVIRTLTAAYLAGKSVKLREVTNSGTCTVDYVTM